MRDFEIDKRNAYGGSQFFWNVGRGSRIAA
jgi:hypothetical protein